jgi:hypothetical protein
MWHQTSTRSNKPHHPTRTSTNTPIPKSSTKQLSKQHTRVWEAFGHLRWWRPSRWGTRGTKPPTHTKHNNLLGQVHKDNIFLDPFIPTRVTENSFAQGPTNPFYIAKVTIATTMPQATNGPITQGTHNNYSSSAYPSLQRYYRPNLMWQT